MKKNIQNLFYMLKIIWNISPSRILLELCFYLFDYAQWFFFSVLFWRYIIGEGDNARSFKECAIFLVIVLICSQLVEYFLNRFYERDRLLGDIRIHAELNRKLFTKAASVDISCYETPEFYSKYTLATAEAATRGIATVHSFSILVSALIFSAVGIWIMVDITPLCLPFILLPLFGYLFVSRRSNEVGYETDKEITEHKRIYDYVERTVYLSSFAGEIRMTGIFQVLEHMFNRTFRNIINTVKKYQKLHIWYYWLGCILVFVISLNGMWLVASWLALAEKSISVADFVVLGGAIATVTSMMGKLTDSIIAISRDSIYIQNLRDFLAYEPKIHEEQKGILVTLPVQTLELRNVSFRYEGQTDWALQGINMTLHSGERVALVGVNGAGKSTLVKLIMRLYDPTEGVILLNGIDIRNYDLHNYRQLIGATFQDFALFSASVLENILLDNIKDEEARQRALNALRDSGVLDKINTLPKGADTILTREIDPEGALLSGGEGQKIAVARAFAKDCPIVILDEPSSALDPVAEFNMYESILRLTKKCDKRYGKISIIISHRLSAAALSDRIFVLDNSRLSECGTHKELMTANGTYAEMFRKQAESYMATESEVNYHA